MQDDGYTDMFAGKIKVGQEGCRVGGVSGVVEVVANSVVEIVVVVVVAGGGGVERHFCVPPWAKPKA